MKKVTIVEVGLRDGLQNESTNLFTEDRVELAYKLAGAGIQRMELGAFVRPDWVPQMAGSKEVIEKVLRLQKENKIPRRTEFAALVPNEKGMLSALDTKIKEVAVFASTSESFSKKNINCTIAESFKRFEPVFRLAKQNKIKVRGYLSTCFGCPYEGKVPEARVVKLAHRLYQMGCYEISIGDTIGVATPKQVQSLFSQIKKRVPLSKIAGHFHDTRGTALVNIYSAFKMGVDIFDSSIGGLGGCPYAPGSAGNVSTEDVVYLFHGMGIKTGINLQALLDTNRWIGQKIGRKLVSKMGGAGLPKPIGKVT